jgi:tRNA 2-thiocytidine biosynthesis protein TtcA
MVDVTVISLYPPSSISRLCREVEATLETWQMLRGVTRLGVAVSGGADSYAMLHCLHRVLPPAIELRPVFIHQYASQSPADLATAIDRDFGLSLDVAHRDTSQVATRQLSAGRGPCRACAPIRAASLSQAAATLQYDAIALGHHLDDVAATLLLNIFHGSRVESMQPVTLRRGTGAKVIRPLYLSTEADVKGHSGIGQGGLFDCGMCSTHSLERNRAQAFVADTFNLHGSQAVASMREVITQLAGLTR